MLTQKEIDEARASYSTLLTEINMTDIEVELMSFTNIILDCIGNARGLKLGESQVHKLGLFTTRTFIIEETVGIAAKYNIKYLLGRFANHSPNPNIKFIYKPNRVIAKATRDILSGEELFVDYRDNIRQLGLGCV